MVEGWAVQRAKRFGGEVIVDCHPSTNEARIWQVALGWPTEAEIEWEKREGGRAFRCRVMEVGDGV